MEISPQSRINAALDIAESYAGYDGEHHKAWCIDQMIRALLGCPYVAVVTTDHKGEAYTYIRQGENADYLNWVEHVKDGEDGPDTYTWDVGIPP